MCVWCVGSAQVRPLGGVGSAHGDTAQRCGLSPVVVPLSGVGSARGDTAQRCGLSPDRLGGVGKRWSPSAELSKVGVLVRFPGWSVAGHLG